jgi:CoA:oxalate CoA-transferase
MGSPHPPLSGIRVLAVENFIAGPVASMWLADAGAEVVKIEHPETGDQARNLAPFRDSDGERRSMSFMRANRNKKSVALDIKDERGHQLVLDLIRSADVFLENLNPTALSRQGLDYESVRSVAPSIIYVSVSGYGRGVRPSPLTGLTAFDAVGQAASGLMWRPSGATEAPVYLGFPLTDLYAATLAVTGTYQALFHRERTGEGAHVDISLVDGGAALNELSIISYSSLGTRPQPGLHALTAPFGAYLAADGYVVIGVLGEAIWQRFSTAIGAPELLDRKEFADGILRHKNLALLMETLQPWLDIRTVEQVVAELSAHGVPSAPVVDIDGVLASEHLRQRGMLIDVEDPVWGSITMAGNPLKTSLVPDDAVRPAPALGADTDEVLMSWLQSDPGTIATLREQSVIA